MNALQEIQDRRDHDAAMVGIAEARRRLEERRAQDARDLAMIVLGMCLTGQRKDVLGKLPDGVGLMEVDLVLEDIRENKRERAVEFFQRRGIKVAAQGSVFESLLNSLSERLSERRVSNAINLLRITPRGDSEALGEALEAVKEAIGQ
jgi:hypothetical protein